MIAAEQFRRIAFWSSELTEPEVERARRGTVEKAFAKGSYICHRGDKLDVWIGVAEGLLKLGTISETGKEVTLAGLRTGGWFGEGSVLKGELRRYEVIALRDTTLALLDRASFLWLFENSADFNRFLVGQLNERLGQFMGLLENDRLRDPEARVARALASMFNPVLYPEAGAHLVISQEEVGLLAGVSRPVANQALKTLASDGVLRVEYGGLTVLDLERLRGYGG